MKLTSLLTHAALGMMALATAAHADPQLTSWFTAHSGRYARIYQTAANEATGPTATVTTWSRGTGHQRAGGRAALRAADVHVVLENP